MGTCSSSSGTVRPSNDGTEVESSPDAVRDTVVEQLKQDIGNLTRHLADLTSKIKLLEVNAADNKIQIDSLKQDVVKLEKDLTAIRNDFDNLRSEMERKPTSNSITIMKAEMVHAGDRTYLDHSKTNYTASEMFADNSYVTHVNTKEKHNSGNKNTKIRTVKAEQLPILHTPVVHSTRMTNYPKKTNSFTASEISTDTSYVTPINPKEKHGSGDENNKIREEKSDHVPILQANLVNADAVHASAVPVSDSTYHEQTTDTYIDSEMLVDNSNATPANTKEEHDSGNENNKTHAESANQIPVPRPPKWKI